MRCLLPGHDRYEQRLVPTNEWESEIGAVERLVVSGKSQQGTNRPGRRSLAAPSDFTDIK